MKLVSSFLYNLKQGIKGILKNKTMSFISIISVTSALIILGIVLTMVLNINQFIKVTEDEINEVRVSVKTDLDENKKEEVKENILKIKGVKKAVYKSKEESFESMRKNWGEDAYLLEGVNNPLDDYYVVTIDNKEGIKSIEPKLLSIQGIKNVDYHQDVMENFLHMSNIVKKFGTILILCLLLICLVIIANTIKGRVYNKKEEIQIIKYVGASNWFVIGPFIVEGFMIGLIGSVLSVLICIGMYGYILDKIVMFISSVMGNVVLPLTTISTSLIVILVITGISVGVLGSIVSVRRHLKV
ncbi:ABC transporter permease [Romboutsia maritimum]|uniref:Cell division protein FtsX n=1 Tax=Romboutsia maritimum TaxID=2020948 RepID=A0A371IVI4_9FIRM|nr:permease-like cell division protein FtsX [Romboutsia maritimum]RDY24469.1 ABC transporter permease [Romboutsia maritimum]